MIIYLISKINLYLALCLVSVTIHISKPYPTPQNPNGYDLAGCSGVFISGNEVLTAAHCVKHSRGRQWIKTNEGKSYPAIVEKTDDVKDLAILKIPALESHLYADFGKPLSIAQKIYTVNSGDGYERTYNEGIVNNLFPDDETNTLMVMHSATIFAGASGSGLFDAKGRLVGINTETLHSLSGAVDLVVIKEFLKIRN